VGLKPEEFEVEAEKIPALRGNTAIKALVSEATEK